MVKLYITSLCTYSIGIVSIGRLTVGITLSEGWGGVGWGEVRLGQCTEQRSHIQVLNKNAPLVNEEE